MHQHELTEKPQYTPASATGVQIGRLSIRRNWQRLAALPGGKRLFSWLVGRAARYTGSIGARVDALGDGHCRVVLRDRSRVRNHLGSVHAIALINLAEMATGLALIEQIDGRGRGILKGIEMEYLKKARGTLTAEARCRAPESPGTHLVLVEGSVRDEAGDVVATARARWKIDLAA